MSSKFEPTKEIVHREMADLSGVWAYCSRGDRWEAVARFILQRQHAREKGLLFALRWIADGQSMDSKMTAGNALAAHAALDAAPEPTLLEAAKRIADGHYDDVSTISVPVADFRALKAAVERAERERAK